MLDDRSIPVADLARAVEAAGLESLFLTEHTHLPVRRETELPVPLAPAASVRFGPAGSTGVLRRASRLPAGRAAPRSRHQPRPEGGAEYKRTAGIFQRERRRDNSGGVQDSLKLPGCGVEDAALVAVAPGPGCRPRRGWSNSVAPFVRLKPVAKRRSRQEERRRRRQRLRRNALNDLAPRMPSPVRAVAARTKVPLSVPSLGATPASAGGASTLAPAAFLPDLRLVSCAGRRRSRPLEHDCQA